LAATYEERSIEEMQPRQLFGVCMKVVVWIWTKFENSNFYDGNGIFWFSMTPSRPIERY
jgi:hypothetical protein